MTMYGEKRLTQALTYSGGIPFVGLAVMAAAGFEKDWAVNAFIAYGAVIAGFMGGTIWSQAQMTDVETRKLLALSNVAALVAWAALIVPGPLGFGLALQAGAFALLLGLDWRIRKASAQPEWYFMLRRNISAIVIASYGLMALVA
ncbi:MULTISPECIES: DUF3429 domain-containing protein [unclassified Rhizobium]|uniref:DUF3429 domain-containing protein n=1 Tax=unclassified Rhizobium TaxID=2613769 RepID=UPI0015FF0DE9|nr:MULTISPECIES: DUF3429 domain-containing protein [unclassified Rhizobium]MBB1251366.1 DUF3429 domain-containing protein [Rhizobium sp. G21]MCV3767880.1 DUF3429 domain-containing protein [Rhizobium sp. TRM95796]